jgi:hypothetical protein
LTAGATVVALIVLFAGQLVPAARITVAARRVVWVERDFTISVLA